MFQSFGFKFLGTLGLALFFSLGLWNGGVSPALAGGGYGNPPTAPAPAPYMAPANMTASTSGAGASAPAVSAACSSQWSAVDPQATGMGEAITGVAAGSPAAGAGLQMDEVILSVNGVNLSQGDDLTQMLSGDKPGQSVSLKVAFPGQAPNAVSVTLGQDPQNANQAYLGADVQMTPVVYEPFDLVNTSVQSCQSGPVTLPIQEGSGLYLTSVAGGSAAAKAGLMAGDVIVDANGTPVNNPYLLDQLINTEKPGSTLNLTVYRMLGGQKTMPVAVTVEQAADNNQSQAPLGAQTADIILATGSANAAAPTISYASPTVTYPAPATTTVAPPPVTYVVPPPVTYVAPPVTYVAPSVYLYPANDNDADDQATPKLILRKVGKNYVYVYKTDHDADDVYGEVGIIPIAPKRVAISDPDGDGDIDGVLTNRLGRRIILYKVNGKPVYGYYYYPYNINLMP
jgi:membrane-associated protease RseP (regulator of RpoE activity)